MARKIRIEYPGAIYHVMSRGNHQEVIFKDNKDCEIFLDTLGEACTKAGWLVHAFVLMGNHYHLLLETPNANLVAGMKWLQGTYTQRFNARHKVWGHLLQGRYKALVIDGERGEYFSTVCNYIHLNPARAKLFNLKEGRLSDYPWSSYTGYLFPTRRPEWLCVERSFASLDCSDDQKGRARFRRLMKKRVLEVERSHTPHTADTQWNEIRRGWCFGEEGFREQMLGRIDAITKKVRRDSLEGGAVRSHDLKAAEKLLGAVLLELGIDRINLPKMPKGAKEKKLLAWALRKHTTVSREWITEQLHMGHVSRVTQSVREVSNTDFYSKEKCQLDRVVKLSD